MICWAPPAEDDPDFDDSLTPGSPTDGVSVADSLDSSASLEFGFSMLFSTTRRKRPRSQRSARSRRRSSNHDNG